MEYLSDETLKAYKNYVLVAFPPKILQMFTPRFPRTHFSIFYFFSVSKEIWALLLSGDFLCFCFQKKASKKHFD